MRHHTAENNFFEKVLSAKYNNGVEKKEPSNRKKPLSNYIHNCSLQIRIKDFFPQPWNK